jgi:hypothetical protein
MGGSERSCGAGGGVGRGGCGRAKVVYAVEDGRSPTRRRYSGGRSLLPITRLQHRAPDPFVRPLAARLPFSPCCQRRCITGAGRNLLQAANARSLLLLPVTSMPPIHHARRSSSACCGRSRLVRTSGTGEGVLREGGGRLRGGRRRSGRSETVGTGRCDKGGDRRLRGQRRGKFGRWEGSEGGDRGGEDGVWR